VSKPFSLSPEDRSARVRPATYLFRAAACHARARINKTFPEQEVKAMFGDDRITGLLLKGATAPATTGSAAWAGALAAQAVDDTIAAMTSLSAGADLIARGTRVDMTGIAQLTVPGRLVNAAAAGAWVPESASIPVRSQSITSGAVLEPRKLAVIATMTSEIAMSSNVEAVTRALLSESAGLALDAAMFSPNADDGAHPAGLLHNVTPLTPTAGGGVAAMTGDLSALAGALAAAGGGRDAALIVNPAQATSLKLMAGPRFDVPILASAGVPAKTVVLIEASSLVSGFSAIPEFETSSVALLHMEDAAPADWGTPMKSMFQADSFALKMILKGTWAMRSPHVAVVNNVTW
jgi:hypothetical protein